MRNPPPGSTPWRMGLGQIYVAAADAAAITVSDTGVYYEATEPVWSVYGDNEWFDESAGNGRLTYIASNDVMVHVACTISMTSGAQNNQVTHWRLGKNGTSDEMSEVQRKIGTGTDVGSTALHLVQMLSKGDYVSLFVRNATGTNDIVLECANLQAMTMPR